MFTRIFVLRIRVCTNIGARSAAEEKFVPHIPLVPSVLFTAGTEPSKQQFTREYLNFREQKVLKRLKKTKYSRLRPS